MTKKGYNSVLKVLNDSQWIRTITFSDNIVIEDGKINIRFEYSEILNVTEDNKCFYLFFNADMVYRILKDSFISGSPDEFREFINNAVIIKAKEIEMAEDDLGL